MKKINFKKINNVLIFYNRKKFNPQYCLEIEKESQTCKENFLYNRTFFQFTIYFLNQISDFSTIDAHFSYNSRMLSSQVLIESLLDFLFAMESIVLVFM